MAISKLCDEQKNDSLPAYPFLAKSTATCRPIPRDAPTMRATCLVVVGISVLLMASPQGSSQSCGEEVVGYTVERGNKQDTNDDAITVEHHSYMVSLVPDELHISRRQTHALIDTR